MWRACQDWNNLRSPFRPSLVPCYRGAHCGHDLGPPEQHTSRHWKKEQHFPHRSSKSPLWKHFTCNLQAPWKVYLRIRGIPDFCSEPSISKPVLALRKNAQSLGVPMQYLWIRLSIFPKKKKKMISLKLRVQFQHTD